MSEAPETRRAALITGAGSGIGRAVAMALASEGFDLALVGRRRDHLEETARLIGADGRTQPRVLVIPADVAESVPARQAAESAIQHFGRLDVLVNNAGYAPLASIDRTTPDLLDRAFRVNALGPANLIAAAWPALCRCGGACIINISTLGTRDPFPGFFAYASAKGAVNVMARSCAKEGKAHGVKAFAIAPGAVETPMLRANFSTTQIPPSRALPPEAVADVAVRCVRGEFDARSGDTLFVSAGRGVE